MNEDVETSRELGSLTNYPPLRGMDPEEKHAFVLRVVEVGIDNAVGKDRALIEQARRSRTEVDTALQRHSPTPRGSRVSPTPPGEC